MIALFFKFKHQFPIRKAGKLFFMDKLISEVASKTGPGAQSCCIMNKYTALHLTQSFREWVLFGPITVFECRG